MSVAIGMPRLSEVLFAQPIHELADACFRTQFAHVGTQTTQAERSVHKTRVDRGESYTAHASIIASEVPYSGRF